MNIQYENTKSKRILYISTFIKSVEAVFIKQGLRFLEKGEFCSTFSKSRKVENNNIKIQ